jgi:hypothetical protein
MEEHEGVEGLQVPIEPPVQLVCARSLHLAIAWARSGGGD